MKTTLLALLLCSACFGQCVKSAAPLPNDPNGVKSPALLPNDTGAVRLPVAPFTGNTVIFSDHGAKMATIESDGTVTVEKPFTAEQVIVKLLHYAERESLRAYTQHQAELQACFKGWRDSLDLIGGAAKKPKGTK